jgi:hypothetical protein
MARYTIASANFAETEYDSTLVLSCTGLAACATLASSAEIDAVPANARVVGAAGEIRVDQSFVTALPRATRMMMNNCAIPYFKEGKK